MRLSTSPSQLSAMAFTLFLVTTGCTDDAVSQGDGGGHASSGGPSVGGAGGTTTAAAGGGGGAGGSPRVASPCDNLPPPGTWEKISPPGTVEETKSVAVDPFDSAIVWVADEHGLNKSTDCGSTWELVSTGENGANLADSSLWSIAVDPVEQGTIYLVGGYGALGLWRSKDGGVSWKNLFPPGSEYAQLQDHRFVNNVSMDPFDHQHLVITTHGTCNAPYAPNCNGESFDGGDTWRFSIAPANWPEGGGAYVVDATTWLWCEPFGGIWRTTNNGASFQKVKGAYGCNGEFTNQLLLPASDGAYYMSSIGGILRSSDAGATWENIHQGKFVGFTMSSTTLYAADQWSGTYASAPIADPTNWTPMPAPTDHGAPFLVYDEAHHILYASLWPQGLWRLVTE